MHAGRKLLMQLASGLMAAFVIGGIALAEGLQDQPRPPVSRIAPDAAKITQFQLDGLVMTPATYDRAALAAMPQSVVTAGTVTYTGVPLWMLLSKAGIITHPDIKNSILRDIVTATAKDGYKVVISLGEIDPDFGNQPCLIAIQQNGADFPSGGFARLVLPNDVKKGRWVHDLTGLTVSESP